MDHGTPLDSADQRSAAQALGPVGTPSQPDGADKEFRTMCARAALAGYELRVGDRPGEYLVWRWGLARVVGSLHEAGEFLDRVGAAR
jgi:hypothetical protein